MPPPIARTMACDLPTRKGRLTAQFASSAAAIAPTPPMIVRAPWPELCVRRGADDTGADAVVGVALVMVSFLTWFSVRRDERAADGPAPAAERQVAALSAGD